MDFIAKIEELNKQIDAVREEFKFYITCDIVPLEDRWNVFLKAPPNLRVTKGYVQHFKGVPEDFIMYDGPLHAERYETIDVELILEALEQNLEEVKGIDIEAFKEDVLSKNIYSYQYDW